MVEKETTAVLVIGLSKPFRMWHNGLQHFKFQLKTNFSVVFLYHIANFLSSLQIQCSVALFIASYLWD